MSFVKKKVTSVTNACFRSKTAVKKRIEFYDTCIELRDNR